MRGVLEAFCASFSPQKGPVHTEKKVGFRRNTLPERNAGKGMPGRRNDVFINHSLVGVSAAYQPLAPSVVRAEAPSVRPPTFGRSSVHNTPPYGGRQKVISHLKARRFTSLVKSRFSHASVNPGSSRSPPQTPACMKQKHASLGNSKSWAIHQSGKSTGKMDSHLIWRSNYNSSLAFHPIIPVCRSTQSPPCKRRHACWAGRTSCTSSFRLMRSGPRCTPSSISARLASTTSIRCADAAGDSQDWLAPQRICRGNPCASTRCGILAPYTPSKTR